MALPPFGGGINKIINKHPYIEYNKDIPDLTNDILFDMIWGFWGYFVMVLNGFIYKGLSDMSVLYVIAGPSAAGSGREIKPN